MNKIFCFGELLLRLSPELDGKWLTQSLMPVYIGGAELNTATALAKWNVPVTYCTALPGNYLSKEICEELDKRNINTGRVIFSGNRIGTYYLPQGSDLKNAGVIYDRAWSSFSELQPGQIDWDVVLAHVSWFHFSAISPALNQNIATICKEAVEVASKRKITISVDLNYRSKLWQYGKKPKEIMPALVEHCDVVMGNIWSADDLLDIGVDADIHNKKSKLVYLEHAKKTAENIMRSFPACKSVANTFRFDDGDRTSYYASFNINGGQFVSQEFSTNKVVDKVGSGDCFMAGLIYGFYNKLGSREIIDFASAAAFNKLFVKGDATTSTVEEIMALVKDTVE
ncbi:MAG: sugar kinase [Ginsengibacter sp.]